MLISTTPDSNNSTPPRKKVNGERLLNANRANARKSTGPRSPEGKARSRFNSLKHGLTAQEVCLPGESREEYDHRRVEYFEDHRPATLLEADILDDYIAARWRKDRAIRHEKCLLLEKFMQRRANIAGQYESITLDVETALAFRDLGDESAVLKNLDRYELRILRNIQIGYNQLMELRANRPPVPSALAPQESESQSDPAGDPILSDPTSHGPNPGPAPLTNAIHTTVLPRKQPPPIPKTMVAGETVRNEPVPKNEHSPLTATTDY